MTDYLERLLEQDDESGCEPADEEADWNAGIPAPAGAGKGEEPEVRTDSGRMSAIGAAARAGQEPPEGLAFGSVGADGNTPGSAGAAGSMTEEAEEAADGTVPVWPDAAVAGSIRRPADSRERGGQAAVWGADQSGSVGALYEQLVRSRAAAAVSARGTASAEYGQLERAEGVSPSAVLDAAELDRMFQRDARRYDGGFSLL